MDVETQAAVVVTLEAMFGIKRVDQPKSSDNDLLLPVQFKPMRIKTQIKGWFGSDWRDEQGKLKEDSSGRLYIANYGEFWLEGTLGQIQLAYIYTTSLGQRLEQARKEEASRIIKVQ